MGIKFYIFTFLHYMCTSIISFNFTGNTNLKILHIKHLPHILRSIFKGLENITMFNPPSDWSHDWSQKLWSFLKQNFSDDLSQFEGLPILAASANSFIKLSLSEPVLLAGKSNLTQSSTLPDYMQTIVKKLGVLVIQSLPLYVELHPSVLDNYVMLPDVGGVLNVLVAAAQRKFPSQTSDTWHNWQEHVFEKLSADEKRTFRKFISTVANVQSKSSFKTYWHNLCRHLQLFEIHENMENNSFESFTSVAMCSKMASTEKLSSLPLLTPLLDATDASAVTLAGWFGIQPMSNEEVLVKIIFDNVKRKVYSSKQLEELIEVIIPSYMNRKFMNQTISEFLCSLEFIPTNSGKIKLPSELYDSSDNLLCELFEGQDVFPSNIARNFLPYLKKLGLKTRMSITDMELVSVAEDIHHRPSIVKSVALLHLIKSTISHAAREKLSQLEWIAVTHERPTNYPDSLPWAGELVTFSSPVKVVHEAYVDMCGSVCIFPRNHPNVNSIFNFLSGQKEPNIQNYVSHLFHVVENYNNYEKPQYLQIVIKLYEKLQFQSAREYFCSNATLNLKKWIWHGDGFCEPSRCFIDKVVCAMSPHAFCLPEELKRFLEFFRFFGVRDKVDKMELLNWIAQWYSEENRNKISAAQLYRDTELVIKILNEVRDDIKSNKLKLNEILNQIFIPVETNSQSLRLVKSANCTYYDGEWQIDSVEYKDLQIIHHDIPIATAQCLGIPSLTSRLISAEELEFESYGQSEPLTTRIKNLIKDYSDGLSVLKEFIQNADDAGATEVCFLIDERENLNARSLLLDKKFSSCQGPAIVVYNNATFSDDDFQNIVKIGGAAKEKNSQKIGQFGLGFNSVYNITDVPCFLSRNILAIFDPHMKYISNVCRNKTNPGVKISLDTLIKHSAVYGDQIKPFQHLFGCKVDESSNSFQGTIFRLPLRTPDDAIESEICKKHYSRDDVFELFKLLFDNGQNFLLFTQNVKKIELHHLSKTDESSAQMKLLYKVTKTGLNKLQSGLTTCCDEDFQFLKWAAEVMKKQTDNFPSQGLNVSLITELASITTLYGNKLLAGKDEEIKKTINWLISQSIGKDESLNMAKNEAKLLPFAGVAIKLIKYGKDYRPVCLVPTSEDPGLLFCFLPLPEQSYLPVHVNGCFALSSSRRHLMTAYDKGKKDIRAEWNYALFVDALVEAYISAVKNLRFVVGPHVDDIFTLWPLAETNKQFVSIMTKKFYEHVIMLDIQLFPNQNDWYSFRYCKILEGTFRFSIVGDIAQSILIKLSKIKYCGNIIELPKAQWFYLQEVIQHKEKLINPLYFFEEYFLPYIEYLDRSLVDYLLIYALFTNDCDFSECLKRFPCIPVKPSGKFKNISDLIHPLGLVAPLFDEAEECFPEWSEHNISELNHFYHSFTRQTIVSNLNFCHLVYDALVALGMKYHDIPTDQLKEKAAATKSHLVKLKPYCNAILKTLEKKIIEKSISHDDIDYFKMTSFLPVKVKPEKCTINWFGDIYSSTLIASASSLYLEESTSLICCIAPIVDESQVTISPIIRRFLNFKEKQSLTFDLLLQQLTVINDSISNFKQTYIVDSFDFVRKTCLNIYTFLSQNIEPEGKLELFNHFNNIPFILLGHKLVKPSLCSFTLDFNCDPYLFGLLNEPLYLETFKPLMKCIGVKDTFNSAEYNRCLQCMSEQFGYSKLSENDMQKAINVSLKLVQVLDKEEKNVEQLLEKYGPVYLPDERGILRRSSDLVYNETPWFQNEQVGINFICEKLGYGILKRLGGKTLREEILCQTMLPFARSFGQKEKLTIRLKKIIATYPKDESILRELLQNADDAGCSEIHFILDPRNHKAENVFSEEWKQLQGPSLLVLNDKCFSDEDLRGIQNLGEGSKGNDSLKTGQFGVGFNCVYHLTDCPSILTSTPSTGSVLCIFDPHRKFIPHATHDNPGCLFNDIDKLKIFFPDVLSCYTDKLLPKQATVFRFPLRTNYMAATSSISTRVVKADDVRSMFEKFKSDAENCLLFLRNVTTIKISTIDELKFVLNTFFIQSSLHKENLFKKNKFNDKLRLYSEQIRHVPLHLIKERNNNLVSYELSISKSNNESSQWLVVQQFGLSEAKSVSTEIVSAIEQNNIGMLLQGGVALKLPSDIVKESAKTHKKMRLYCFLPLPVTTHLPVHINGFFALDNEARRNLFKDRDNSILSYRSLWNVLLMEKIIAPAYVEMLVLVKAKLTSNNLASLSRDNIRRSLQNYVALFPAFDTEADVYINILVKAVYNLMANDCFKLFPTLRSKSNNILIDVSWLPPVSDTVEMTPIFDSFHPQIIREHSEEIEPIATLLLSFVSVKNKPSRITVQPKGKNLKEILLNCGMNVVEFPEKVYSTCKEIYGKNFREISPSLIGNFFKVNGKFSAQSIMPMSPRFLNETPLKNTKNVIEVLKYYFNNNENLPDMTDIQLLVTVDGLLRCYSSQKPVFVSSDFDLVPTKIDLFIHYNLLSIFEDKKYNQVILKKFELKNLIELLPECLDKNKWFGFSKKILVDEEAQIINRIAKLWIFIGKCLKTENYSARQNFAYDVHKWCLFPAIDSCPRTVFYPVGKAKALIDLTHGDITSHKLKEALCTLGVPRPDLSIFEKSESSFDQNEDGKKIINMLAGSVNDQSDVIYAIKNLLENQNSLPVISSDQCDLLLDYFSTDLSKVQCDSIQTLRRLPWYETILNFRSDLLAKFVYIVSLPQDIPQLNRKDFHFPHGILFLKENIKLHNLYIHLGCKNLTVIKFYCEHLLPVLEATTNDDERYNHLNFLRKTYKNASIEDQNSIKSCFQSKHLKLFPNLAKEIKAATDLMDPFNVLFKLFHKGENNFPHEPYNSLKWYDFLTMAGLIHEISPKKLLDYAKELSSSDLNDQNFVTAKAKTLLEYIFSICDKLEVRARNC